MSDDSTNQPPAAPPQNIVMSKAEILSKVDMLMRQAAQAIKGGNMQAGELGNRIRTALEREHPGSFKNMVDGSTRPTVEFGWATEKGSRRSPPSGPGL